MKCEECKTKIFRVAYKNGKIICQRCWNKKKAKEKNLRGFYQKWQKETPKKKS